MSSFIKLTFKGASRQVFICLRSPPLLGFFWDGLEILSPTGPYNPPPLLAHTVCSYCTLTQGKGGRVEPERRLEKPQFRKLGRKYQHD